MRMSGIGRENPAGEFYVTRSDEVVSTVLGSCIAACVRDTESGVGGMTIHAS